MSKNFKIGVENFRVFKEMTEFDLRPITILVGPNNSGKSSFTKLLLLLKNGFAPLNFKKGEHHLGSCEKALNWNTESEEIVLKNEATYFLSPDYFTEEIRYDKSGKIKEQTITNNNTGQELLKFEFLREDVENWSAIIPVRFSLNIEYIINLLYDKEIVVSIPCVDEISNFSWQEPVPLKRLKKISKKDLSSISEKTAQYFLPNIFLKNYKEPLGVGEKKLILNSILMNEINNLEKDYLLCEVYVNGKKIENKDKILECQKQTFNNLEAEPHNPSDFYQPKKHMLENVFNSLKHRLKQKFEKEYQEFSTENDQAIDVEVKETILGRLIFTENLFYYRSPDDHDFDPYSGYFETSLLQHISSQMFTRLDQLKKIEYIPVDRGNQSRVLFADSNEKTYKEVTDFHNIENNKRTNPFATGDPKKLLISILKEVGINGEIITKHLEDTVSVVYIKKEGKKINLADYGFGYSQLIPIILKIYNLSYQSIFNNSILIIEEPEANLHPNLQAKLADILALVIKHKKGLKVVVETHSEYLIRKLQYLVAKQEVNREDCIIHYFNADENVSKEEPKVKPIEITEEGNLTDNFGPGFFDEATRLQFDLLKLNKNQSN